MDSEFDTLVSGNINFSGVTLGAFSSLPEQDIGIYFDTSTVAGTTFKGKVIEIRNRYKQSLGINLRVSISTPPDFPRREQSFSNFFFLFFFPLK